MKNRIFTGLSEKGDINEAISSAIAKAKEELMTDIVFWELEKINGRNGGFVLENVIEVSILVKA